MARNSLDTEGRVSSQEFRGLVKRLKGVAPTGRSLQLLFWYRKGDRSPRLASLMKSYLDGA